MGRFLVPEWYVYTKPGVLDMNLASIFWGFSLAFSVFAAIKASRQTVSAWKRRGRITDYVWMIWLEWLSSTTMGIIAWLFLYGMISPSLWLFLFLVILWAIQIHCLLQIIINRISLLMVVKTIVVRLKWAVFIIILCVNISVACIWIPARLQISETYIHINDVWDRCEKVVFLTVDASLNIMFIYLVNSRLIANGLQKYRPLFRFNCCMIFISISMDIILIGTMSLPDGFVYVQFHPLAYLCKLHIEMGMADLITKVVRASNDISSSGIETKSRRPGLVPGMGSVGGTRHGTNTTSIGGKVKRLSAILSGCNRSNRVEIRVDEEAAEASPNMCPLNGIQKTVMTEVASKSMAEEYAGSESSSTKQMKK